jgi:GNAT superfamily N-acetyltransferase
VIGVPQLNLLAPAAHGDQAERDADPRFGCALRGVGYLRPHRHRLVPPRRREIKRYLTGHWRLDTPHSAAACGQVDDLDGQWLGECCAPKRARQADAQPHCAAHRSQSDRDEEAAGATMFGQAAIYVLRFAAYMHFSAERRENSARVSRFEHQHVTASVDDDCRSPLRPTFAPTARHFRQYRLRSVGCIHRLSIGSYPANLNSHIASAAVADMPELARLMADSALMQRYGVTFETALEALLAAVANGDVVLLARELSITGLAWLTFAPRLLNGAAYLRLLLVATPGHGTGSHLLAVAEARARERANHLYLLTTTDNARAKRFYERHAYRYVGDLPGLVHPDLDESLYEKALRPYAERLSG